MNKEEQIKSILSVRPTNKLEKVSYEYLEELSINQATKIYVLQQENELLKRNCNIGNENLSFYRNENQQLKSVLDELNKDKVYWINKCANAESVLDEIRDQKLLN